MSALALIEDDERYKIESSHRANVDCDSRSDLYHDGALNSSAKQTLEG